MDAPRDIYDGGPWSEMDIEDLQGRRGRTAARSRRPQSSSAAPARRSTSPPPQAGPPIERIGALPGFRLNELAHDQADPPTLNFATFFDRALAAISAPEKSAPMSSSKIAVALVNEHPKKLNRPISRRKISPWPAGPGRKAAEI
jgi:hypothetical protein